MKENKQHIMKTLVFLTALLFSVNANSQIVGGQIMLDKRKLLTESSFKLEAAREGYAIYTLAVNIEGKVTGAKLEETDLKSTPLKMKIRDHLMNYEFEPGTHYPKFHHVMIKISLQLPIEEEPESEEVEH